MISIEVTAKKVEEAINEGLKKLDAKLDDVDVEILSQGGLFKKAKVRLSMGGNDAAEPEKKAPPKAEKAPKAEKPAKEKPVKQEKPAKEKAEKEKPAETAKTVKQEQRPAASQPDAVVQGKKREAPRLEKKRREENSAEITPEIVGLAEEFLSGVVERMGVKAEMKTTVEGKKLSIELVTDDSAVIGYRGEALDALEYLTSLVSGRGEERYVKLRLDCNGYRAKREESLVALARRMADKCAKNGKKVTLEPMSSAHRRIIHAALTDDERVTTKSEGREPGRRIVILPKKKPQ